MNLVYKETGETVSIGDTVIIDNEPCEVTYFTKPYKPSSEGKVSVKNLKAKWSHEYYVSVIGAEWINREDRL